MKRSIILIVSFLLIHTESNSQTWQELMDSSNAYQQAMDFQTALHWAFKAEVKAKAEFGDMDTNYSETIGAISEIWHYLGHLDSAIYYGELRLKISREMFPIDHSNLANSIYNMAVFYDRRGDYQKAEPLYIESLDMRRRIFKTDHPDLASSINNMANFYDGRGDYKKAEPLYIEDLEMSRRIFKTDHPDLATSINNMAYFYDSRGDYKKAEPLFIEALDMRRRIFKTDHPHLVNSINNMAYFYDGRGDYSKAEPLYIEALDMYRRIFKTDHPELAIGINNMALFFDRRGDFSKAEPLYIEALDMYRRIYKTDHPDLAWSINSMAGFYFVMGDYNKAEPLLIEALKMRRRIFVTDHLDLAESINSMSVFFNRIGDYEKAEPLYIEALDMYRRIFKTDHPILAASINRMADYYNGRGEYEKAKQHYIESLDMYRRIFKTDHPSLAFSINSMGAFYQETGDYSNAELLYIESLDMYRRIFKTDHPNLAASINRMADYYNDRGDYKKAEPLYIESLDMSKLIFKNDHPDLAQSINNMAVFYNGRGDYKKAEPLFIQSLDMYRRIFKTDHPALARSINNVGYFYDCSRDYKKAKPLYIEALEMRRRIFKTDHPELAQSIGNMAWFYFRSRVDYSKAEPLFIEALDMSKRIFKTDHPDLAQSINNIACFYDRKGDYKKAKILWSESLDMNRRIFKTYHQYLALSIYNMAHFYKDRNDYLKAEPLFIEAIEMYKKIYSEQTVFLSEPEKEKFWDKMNKNFELFTSFSEQRYPQNTSIAQICFNNLLFTKGLLLTSANKVKQVILSGSDGGVIDMYNRWSDMRRFISKYSSLPIKELEKKHLNLDSIEKVANDMEKNLSLKSSTFASKMQKKEYTWKDILTELKIDEAAVEIVRYRFKDSKLLSDTGYYAALILKPGKNENQIDFVILENGNELEHLHIKNYKNCIKNKFQDNESYSHFWAKLAAKLKGVKKVYVSPDGVYNQLNLSTLYNPKTKKYLLEEIEIQVVTSTRDLVVNKEQKKPEYNNTAVLIGNPKFNLDKNEYKKIASVLKDKFKSDYYIDEGTELTMRAGIHPLPGTGIEIDQISQLLGGKGWNIEKHTDKQAIEEVVKKVDNPRILHIATHGKFLCDVERQYSNFDTEIDRQRFVENPLLRSYLIFAGADSPDSTKSADLDDGFLTAYEAQNLYLDKTELVVLSACETGLGEIKNGEGVYGLQRAFIQAGAKSIIMSLWSVSDEATQELMSTFYKEWLGGKTKREAFKTAQIKLKEKYNYPFYWGAFVMVGE